MSEIIKSEFAVDATSTESGEQKASNIADIKEKVTKSDEDIEEDDDDDDEVEGDDANVAGDKKKKKKKKGKKKKKSVVTGTKLPLSRCLLGFTDSYTKYGQTDPPTRLVADLFPSGLSFYLCSISLTPKWQLRCMRLNDILWDSRWIKMQVNKIDFDMYVY